VFRPEPGSRSESGADEETDPVDPSPPAGAPATSDSDTRSGSDTPGSDAGAPVATGRPTFLVAVSGSEPGERR
jgi:hypothetical protein